MRRARTDVRAEGASGTPAGSCGQSGDQTKIHACDISRLGVFFNSLAARPHSASGPVAITPGLPERDVRLCLRRRVAAHCAARTAAQEPRQRHPEARPPAEAGDAFGPVFTTGWGVLAPRPEGPHHLAGAMLVDPEQPVGRPAAEAVIRRLHGRRRAFAAPLQWRPQRPRRRALWRRGGAGNRPRVPGGAVPRSGLRISEIGAPGACSARIDVAACPRAQAFGSTAISVTASPASSSFRSTCTTDPQTRDTLVTEPSASARRPTCGISAASSRMRLW